MSTPETDPTPTIRPVPDGPGWRLLLPALAIVVLIVAAILVLDAERPAVEHESEPGESPGTEETHEPVETMEPAAADARVLFLVDGIDLRARGGTYGHASGGR